MTNGKECLSEAHLAEAKYWFAEARRFAALSKDNSRKVGAVIVRSGKLLASGFNTFPHGVYPLPERFERPAKYIFTEHAERNAIYSAAKWGTGLYDSTIYLPWFPCDGCARAIVQVGIKRAVTIEPDWSEEQYKFREAYTILKEGGVRVYFAEDEVGTK